MGEDTSPNLKCLLKNLKNFSKTMPPHVLRNGMVIIVVYMQFSELTTKPYVASDLATNSGLLVIWHQCDLI